MRLPDDFRPLGSYEAWSQEIAGALVWLGEDDPMRAMDELRRADPKRLQLGRVLNGMSALFGQSWQTVGAIHDAAQCSERAEAVELRTALDEIAGNARDGKGAKIRLGRWFEGQTGRVVGEMRLERGDDPHAKQKLWRAGPRG